MAAVDPIRYDFQSALSEPGGISQAQLDAITPDLEAKRDEIFAVDLPEFEAGKLSLPGKDPLDTGFINMPAKLLKAYAEHGDDSELGQILSTAKRIRESVDRVLVLGIGGSYMGMKALMDACCHPYHNELARADRGLRPRMYFEGNNVDNDSMQGLLDLVGTCDGSAAPEQRWAIVPISKSGGTIETAAAFRIFLEAFDKTYGGDRDALAKLVVPVTGRTGKLADLSKSLNCESVFAVPDGVGGRFSILSPVGLLPAAILGINVVELLRGAAQLTQDFESNPFATNLVLQYTAVCHLMEKERDAKVRVLQVWAKSLECFGLWYDQLLAESLGKTEGTGATPLTCVNTRDLHSRAQQHQEGRRDKFYTNVIVENWRRDPLVLNTSERNEDDLNQLAGKSVVDLMNAAIKGTNKAYNDDNRPTADFFLPSTSEASLGQLFQLLMLATVVEGRMLDVNPYGQPGVEAYKKNMKSELGLK